MLKLKEIYSTSFEHEYATFFDHESGNLNVVSSISYTNGINLKEDQTGLYTISENGQLTEFEILMVNQLYMRIST